jgi:cytidylate kinase
MTNFKHNIFKDLDRNSDEFKKIKEEYHHTRVKIFLSKYCISANTALNIFWWKTYTTEMRRKAMKEKKYTKKIIEEPKIKNQYQENLYNHYRYMDEF